MAASIHLTRRAVCCGRHHLQILLISLVLTVGPLSAASALTPARPAQAQSLTGQMVVNRAMQYLHYPYAWTGSSPKTGFSCIGFVWYVFQSLGFNMEGNLHTAIRAYPQVSEGALVPGDIVFFKNTVWKGVSHVAIYIGDGKVISAENFHRGVAIVSFVNDPVEGSYWQQHYLVAERPLGGAGAAPSGGYTGRSPKGTAVVTTSSLNLRSGHSLAAPVVTVLTRGTQLDVYGSSHGWLSVGAAGITGWVVRAGVNITSGSVGRSSGGTWGKRYSHPVKAVVAVDGLHVHNRPSVGATVINTLAVGRHVSIVGRYGGWDHVSVGGTAGWSVAWGLRKAPRHRYAHHRGRSGRAQSRGGYSVAAGVNIHSAPSLTAPVISGTTAGMRVSVLTRRGQFAKIRTSTGVTGWMACRFIRGLRSRHVSHGRPHRLPGRSGRLTITAHLRTGPSLSARIVQWVPARTKVRILKTVPQWDYVRLPSSKRGYVYAQFITRH